jgi:DNA-binding NarL/FixJ family response regulator
VTGRPRVLIVDDHPTVLSALGRVLALDCDVVGLFADGREGADAALRLHPVVTLVDLNLPNFNGLDVSRHITYTNPTAKVMIISAMADDDMGDDVRAAGASGLFQKGAAQDLILAVKRIWAESA